MISYEIAKELKLAGFPQNMAEGDAFYQDGELHFEGEYEDDGASYRYDYHKNLGDYYCKAPDLEDLIEACGEDLLSLIRGAGGTFATCDRNGDVNSIGSTPTEAVARLWLALNKK